MCCFEPVSIWFTVFKDEKKWNKTNHQFLLVNFHVLTSIRLEKFVIRDFKSLLQCLILISVIFYVVHNSLLLMPTLARTPLKKDFPRLSWLNKTFDATERQNDCCVITVVGHWTSVLYWIRSAAWDERYGWNQYCNIYELFPAIDIHCDVAKVSKCVCALLFTVQHRIKKLNS